jgi:hypothetical protein
VCVCLLRLGYRNFPLDGIGLQRETEDVSVFPSSVHRWPECDALSSPDPSDNGNQKLRVEVGLQSNELKPVM